jgi:polyisoprenoid-binding protein YceI
MVQTTPLPPTRRILTGRYLLDPAHTTVGFSARTLGLFSVRGRFLDVSGCIDVAVDPQQSQVNVRVAAGSLQTRIGQRDAHLTGPSFLDAAAYPTLRFRSTSLQPAGYHWRLTGDLTVHGVTRPVTLDFQPLGRSPDDGRLRLTAAALLRRSEFGVSRWRPVIGDTVTVVIHVEATPSLLNNDGTKAFQPGRPTAPQAAQAAAGDERSQSCAGTTRTWA